MRRNTRVEKMVVDQDENYVRYAIQSDLDLDGSSDLDLDGSSCGSCGHISYFSAGFEVDMTGKYIAGWYDDEVSCFGGTSYNGWLEDQFQEYAPYCPVDGPDCEPDCMCGQPINEVEDTLQRFMEFLLETEGEEAVKLLDRIEEVFGK